ncbi:NUDIX hydrolase [Paramicrobacterium agarici]|uniref:NUDIX hydrolase n=1 Tax=Paramicrobacterium agarici TaxID=630514 RepID=UPI00116DC75E|nr:NUDIX domain-containing protein [Microbacterium agarici]TQO21612.1 ADP-ribose pyrophosphatase YjhB (NUDIX family) [Microbacterium agarici]
MTTPREAGRVIVSDEQQRILLLRGSDPEPPGSPTWWFTPGGGCEAGETHAQAAMREVREETGLVLEHVDGPVFEQVQSFRFAGRDLVQHELFFTATVPAFVSSNAGWTPLEKRTLSEAAWWSVDEMRATDETIYPTNIVDIVERFRASGSHPPSA